jgi:hypothetical protein
MRNFSNKGSKSFRTISAMGGDIIPAKAFSRKQAVFNEKAAQYASQGVITTPGYLRLESLAPAAATSVFNFNTLDTSGTKTATERRLKLSDTFTVTDISFYIGYGSATSNAPTAAQYAGQQLATFPNPNLSAFSGKDDDLEVLYNGFLQLRIDTTTFLDSIPMRQFYRVGTSQAKTGATGGTAPTQLPVGRDEWPLAMYGRNELLPTIELNGQSNIEWSINLPNATDCSGASTYFTNCVLILQGFLNQGAAGVQKQMQARLRRS